MALEVTIGPKLPIGKTDHVMVVIAFDSQVNNAGAAVHATIVMNDAQGETDEAFTRRAAGLAKKLLDDMSARIDAGAYRKRAGQHSFEGDK